MINKRKIAVWMSGLLAKPLMQFINEIQNQGFDVIVVCSTSADKKLIKDKWGHKLSDVVSISGVFDDFWEKRSEIVIEKVVDQARLNEKQYNTNMMEMIKADRHMGRGFIKGAWFPRSLFSESLNYYDYLDIVNRTFDFFEIFFTRHKIDVFVLEVASFYTKAACVAARSKNIQIRIPHPSRIETGYFFAHNEFIEIPCLEKQYHKNLENLKLDSSGKKRPEIEESYKLAKSEISGYLEYRSFKVTIKNIIRQVMVHFYQKLKKIKKYSPYFVRDRVKAVWLYHRGIKQAEKQKFLKYNQLKKSEYLFYPLQLEPESAMMVMSPEFDHQLYLIHILASNLPAGWKLIVKEHPLALGTRPSGFIEKISAYPNVDFADPFESAREWYLNSQALVMITGSLGYEAALEGIPVISFGKHNLIKVLDFVFEVDSYESAQKVIDRILKRDIPDFNERQKKAYVLKETLRQVSFPLDDNLTVDKNGNCHEMVVFVNNLIASLKKTQPEDIVTE